MALDETGGAGDLLGGAGGGSDTAAGGGGSDTVSGGGGNDTVGGGGDPDWLQQFSAEADGDGSSPRDWIKSKGFTDLNALARSYREAEKAIRDSGRIKVPGEGASEDDIKAFRTAIGVPADAKDYTFKLPDGIEEKQLNMPLIENIKAAALAAGMPKGTFEALIPEVIKSQMDQISAETTRQDGLAAEWLKQQGAQKDAAVAQVDQAARGLGLNKADMQGLRSALGADRALSLLSKIGAGITEDRLTGGGGDRFGVSAEEAQRELDAQNKTPGILEKLKDPKSPESIRRARLLKAVEAAKAQQQQES